MAKELHLFDFDGTITNKDSLFEFLKFCNPDEYNKIYLQFFPKFAQAKFGFLDKGKVKEQFIVDLLKDISKPELDQLSIVFFKQQNIIRPKAKDRLAELMKKPEAKLCMVSASLDVWLQPFANAWNMQLICTKAKFEQNVFVGFNGKNCNYEQKKVRILEELDLNGFEKIFAYGDSNGDKAMFSLAHESFFKPFK